ncbi:uncharacterized protein [Typha angustifolia]|uniref:uncharacterized protein isoform X1 n=1 Tax=Typha angustifolia TaxID=59011 RepID=UPI003C2C71BE
MMQISMVSILVGLLFITAQGEVVMATNSQKTFKSNKELRSEAKIVEEMASKWFRGRKMRMGDAFKEMKANEKNSAANFESIGKFGHGGKRGVSSNCESNRTIKNYSSSNCAFGSSNIKESNSSTILKSRALSNLSTETKENAHERAKLSNAQESIPPVSQVSRSQKEFRLPDSRKFHDQIPKTEKQTLLVATAEIFRLLNKDYHDKPRRHPPVNN